MEDLRELSAGEMPTHEEWNELVRRYKEQFSSPEYYEDELGRVLFGQNTGETLTVVGFVLTEDMNETTQGEASCTVLGTWTPSDEAYSGTETGVVVDNSDPQIFSAALSGASGIGFLRSGNARQVIVPTTIYC